jgi:hypothetical protein
VLLGTTVGLREIIYDLNYNIRVNNSPCSAIRELDNLPITSLNKITDDEILLSFQKGYINSNDSLNRYTLLEEPATTSENTWLNSVLYNISGQKH